MDSITLGQSIQLLNQAIYDYTMFKKNSCDHNRKSGLNIVKITIRIKAFSANLGEVYVPTLETIDQFVERLKNKYADD